MIFREFAFTTRIDDGIELVELAEGVGNPKSVEGTSSLQHFLELRPDIVEDARMRLGFSCECDRLEKRSACSATPSSKMEQRGALVSLATLLYKPKN